MFVIYKITIIYIILIVYIILKQKFHGGKNIFLTAMGSNIVKLFYSLSLKNFEHKQVNWFYNLLGHKSQYEKHRTKIKVRRNGKYLRSYPITRWESIRVWTRALTGNKTLGSDMKCFEWKWKIDRTFWLMNVSWGYREKRVKNKSKISSLDKNIS